MFRAAAAIVTLAGLAAILSQPGPSTGDCRRSAIRRGIHFIYRTATDPQNFADYGADYLWCFHCISSTSADPELRWLALRMGQERARHWRRDHDRVPDNPSASQIQELSFGSYAADCLGLKDDAMKRQLLRAAERIAPEQFLEFDPVREPVPSDVPEACEKCRARHSRGVLVCRRCGTALKMMSRYDVMEDALVAAYTGSRFGVRLGRSYTDLVRRIPSLRPYRGYENGKNPEYDSILYMITHLIYTLNDYSTYRLRREWLQQEYDFLRANLRHGIALDDPESVGEFMDTLKSFGLGYSDPLLRDATAFLLSRQNPDGSWGEMKASDIYSRYHPTWTAIDGLRDYAWKGHGVSFPEALQEIREVK